jgi:hypothetical protein
MDEEIIILDDDVGQIKNINISKINNTDDNDDCIIIEEIKPTICNKKTKKKTRKTISTACNDDDNDVIILDEIKSSSN